VTEDSELLSILRSIDRRLSLLTAQQEAELRGRFASDVLRTPPRVRMFELIDGRTGSPDIAKAAGTSDRAAQLFVQDLLKLGVVKVVGGTTGRGFLVAKDEDAIVRWYLQS
jgi:hypothetical protein